MSAVNILNLLLMYACWKVADIEEPFSVNWYLQLFASALNFIAIVFALQNAGLISVL